MNDTETKVRPATEAKTIVKQGSLGHPMKFLDEKNTKVIMGRIFGFATGVSKSTVEDRETGEEKTLKSLMGSFTAVPVDMSRPRVTSAKLGLPVHIMQGAIDILEANKGEGLIVEIGFDIGAEAAKNAAGYSWFGIPLTELAADDPLAALEAKLSGGKQAQIEPPKADAPEEAADDRAKGNKKK